MIGDKIFFAIIFTTILTILQPASLSSSPDIQKDYYTSGLDLKLNGDWQGALKTWWDAYIRLDNQNTNDPRIGIAFIELVSEMKAEEYYSNASDIYLWGLSKLPPSEFRKDFEEEVKRILPLLDEKERSVWRKALDEQEEKICQFIKLFWLEKDSRPSTTGNERLIEHWQRIAYARKNFKKNKQGVYDCDARGTIYVKYGEPDRKQKGRLGSSSAGELELMRWIRSPRVRSAIKFDDLTPEYELWQYQYLGSEKPNSFLFANRHGSGNFELVEGIESLIPNRQPILQIMYYAELSLFDPIYRDRYFELENIWTKMQIAQRRGEITTSFMSLLDGKYNEHRSFDRLNPGYRFANADRSNYEALFDKIDMKIHDIRLLDQNNQPVLAIISFSYPEFKTKNVTEESNVLVDIPSYELINTLIMRDQSLHVMDRAEDKAPKDLDNISIFMVNHSQNKNHFTISSEVMGDLADSTPTGEQIVEGKKRLHALGKTFFQGSKPLTVNSDSLEVSDWVLGANFPSESYKSHMPFPLVPTRQIYKSDPLQVYCEIYHLRKDANGSTSYAIEFGMTKLDKKGRLDKKAEKISIVNNYETKDQTRKEHFSVDLNKLEPGQYEFFGKVIDKISGQEKIRKEKITILE